MNSAKTGISGTCNGHRIKKFRLFVNCAKKHGSATTAVNGRLTRAGKKSSVSCPSGRKIAKDYKGRLDYGYSLLF